MVTAMGKPVVIDFYAEWCGPCKRQGPILEELKTRMGDSIEIKTLDVDENLKEAQHYRLTVVPTIIIEMDGKVVQKYEGVTDAETLEKVLRPLIR